MPGKARIVKAVLGRRKFRPDPAFEAGMARFLAAELGRDYLLELYQRNLQGEDKFAQMMRRVIIKAVARRCGDGLIVGSQVGFKHLETLEIGNTCFIGAGAYIQGRFDGRCVIGNNVWIGPGAYFDARDLVLGDYVGWGPGAKVLGSAHTGHPRRRADREDGPGDTAGPRPALGGHRHERRPPSRGHRGKGGDRRGGSRGHPRRPPVRDRGGRPGALPAMARGSARAPGRAFPPEQGGAEDAGLNATRAGGEPGTLHRW